MPSLLNMYLIWGPLKDLVKISFNWTLELTKLVLILDITQFDLLSYRVTIYLNIFGSPMQNWVRGNMQCGLHRQQTIELLKWANMVREETCWTTSKQWTKKTKPCANSWRKTLKRLWELRDTEYQKYCSNKSPKHVSNMGSMDWMVSKQNQEGKPSQLRQTAEKTDGQRVARGPARR